MGRGGLLRMSLETLLEAARYVEQLEKKKARAAAAAQAAAANAASAADHSHGVAPHSNHHNSAEPRGELSFFLSKRLLFFKEIK